jgi:hypothetical protein
MRWRARPDPHGKVMLRGTQVVNLRWLLTAALFAVGPIGCSGDGSSNSFTYGSGSESVHVAYDPGAPGHVFDSAVVTLALRPAEPLPHDSLALELMPARGGWCMPVDSFLVLDASGWYRARVRMRPTAPGNYVVRWQSHPFTGFTFYFVARYDSAGQLTMAGDAIDTTLADPPLLLRDTMELVFTYWPHVWYRRVQIIRRADTPRTFYVITQSLQRAPGVSGRTLRPTANLRLDAGFPLRTRTWDRPGWVVDTLSVWVRDTLVAALEWSYDEWVENWEKNYTLFRDWKHDRHPDIYFQVDREGHLAALWTERPPGPYIAAKMTTVLSEPDFETEKKAFIRGGPPPGSPDPR